MAKTRGKGVRIRFYFTNFYKICGDRTVKDEASDQKIGFVIDIAVFC